MHTTSSHRRTLATAVLIAAAGFTLAAPHAAAAPAPVDGSQASLPSCPTDVRAFAAYLRSQGFTAQAANVIAQITRGDCLAQSSPH